MVSLSVYLIAKAGRPFLLNGVTNDKKVYLAPWLAQGGPEN